MHTYMYDISIQWLSVIEQNYMHAHQQFSIQAVIKKKKKIF